MLCDAMVRRADEAEIKGRGSKESKVTHLLSDPRSFSRFSPAELRPGKKAAGRRLFGHDGAPPAPAATAARPPPVPLPRLTPCPSCAARAGQQRSRRRRDDVGPAGFGGNWPTTRSDGASTAARRRVGGRGRGTRFPTRFPTRYPTPAPVHCKIGAWRTWSTCTKNCIKNCGAGSQRRCRSKQSARSGGKACPYALETQRCNAQPCPIDGGSGMWSAWGTCDGGASIQTRARAPPPGHRAPLATSRGPTCS